MKTFKTFGNLILCFTNIYLISFLRLVELSLNHAHCCPLTLLVVIRNRFQVKSVINERDSFSACIPNALDYWTIKVTDGSFLTFFDCLRQSCVSNSSTKVELEIGSGSVTVLFLTLFDCLRQSCVSDSSAKVEFRTGSGSVTFSRLLNILFTQNFEQVSH